MHPILQHAIDNPRFAGPYGSDKGDYGFENIGVRGIDTYIKTNHIRAGGQPTTIAASTPTVIIVGADKGGVGKTTVTRVLLDYLHSNGSIIAPSIRKRRPVR
jgi:hypothetical protein